MAESSEGRLPKIRRWALSGLLLLLSVVGSLAVLEWIAGYLYEHGRFANGKHLVRLYTGEPIAERADAKENDIQSISSHPYLLYTHTPHFTADGYRQTNAWGYRNEEFTVEKPAGTFRILALGGSTTFMWPYVKNPADTWVARLEAKLQAISSRRVEVVNAGLNYGTTAETLAGYTFRHRFLEPDLIIYHGGGNDVLPLLSPDYTPEYTHFRHAGAGMVPRPGERTLLRHSHVLKYLYARWLEPVGSVSVTERWWETDPQAALERVRTRESEGFRRNMNFLVEASRRAGSDVVLFGFLQARKEHLTKNAGVFKGFEEALVVGLEKHYDIMRDIAKRHGALFVAPPQDRFKDEWFQDNCHLTPEGEEVKAQILFDVVKNHPRFRRER